MSTADMHGHSPSCTYCANSDPNRHLETSPVESRQENFGHGLYSEATVNNMGQDYIGRHRKNMRALSDEDVRKLKDGVV